VVRGWRLVSTTGEIKMSEQPEKQEDRKIIEVTLTKDNQIAYKLFGSHVPTLCYVIKLLTIEVDKMIINQQIKNIQGQPGGIILPGKKHNIIDMLRRKNN
jgi:hypothetical protein